MSQRYRSLLMERWIGSQHDVGRKALRSVGLAFSSLEEHSSGLYRHQAPLDKEGCISLPMSELGWDMVALARLQCNPPFYCKLQSNNSNFFSQLQYSSCIYPPWIWHKELRHQYPFIQPQFHMQLFRRDPSVLDANLSTSAFTAKSYHDLGP